MNDMDEFERELKKLQVEKHSDGLDRRVLHTLTEAKSGHAKRPARKLVPVWVAVAAALVLGALGFFAGHLAGISGQTIHTPRGPIEVDLATATGRNLLDFSTASDPLPRGRTMSSVSMGEEK